MEDFKKSLEPEAFALTAEEKNSALWKKIKKNVEERLDKTRRRNDADHDATETAKIRGRILELKYFLTLDGPE